ncbi:MAG: hypothetical protein AAGM67_02260, partial [Bacteroidota bacterium]
MKGVYLRLILILFGSSLLVTACDKGEPFENLPPETSLFLQDINLNGQNRLNSVVRIYWSGEDQDGYVIGYEISTDGQNWGFTSETDSTFFFSIPFGQDSVDVTLFARAIDNDSVADPEPASLIVPLKNRPPVAK